MAKDRNRKVEYRKQKYSRAIHPKIYVWSHAERAEIEYFQSFKNYLRTPLLIPSKKLCGTPQELLEEVVQWKKKEVCDEDGDRVWCIFDVDDFYRNNKSHLINAIKNAQSNNVKIAYANECFELWILLHFERPTVSISRGLMMKKKIRDYFKNKKLGKFDKNKNVFRVLLPFQETAIKNAEKILGVAYDCIDWMEVLDEKGNPSTSIHFLVREIESLQKIEG